MSLFFYLSALMGIIAFLFFSTDWIISLSLWQRRVHIGRWTDRKKWQEAVEEKARQWLHKSPTVQITDQNRLVLWDILTGNYRSHTIQSWQDAGLLFALSEQDAQEYIKLHPHLFDEENIEIDMFLLAYILKIKKALPIEVELRLKNEFASHRQLQETFPYRKALPYIRFVDTIGMVCPLLHAIGFGDLAIRQIEEYEPACYQGIFPPHAYDLKLQKPLGIYDWGRGWGWYILGLIETADLPGNKKRILNFSKQLLSFQREDGGFSCFVFNLNERFESSGSALFGLLFLHAYQLSGDECYLNAAIKIEKSLMKATRRDGTIDFAQGDTKGIGFYSQKFNRLPFAQGMGLYLSKTLDMYEKTIG